MTTLLDRLSHAWFFGDSSETLPPAAEQADAPPAPAVRLSLFSEAAYSATLSREYE